MPPGDTVRAVASTQLQDITTTLRARLDEIDTELATFDALRDERDRIAGALAALENGKPRQTPASPRSSRRATKGQPRRRRAGRGDTQQAVLAYLAEHPDSSASAISEALGLKRNSTSTRLTQMAKAGLIVRSEGRGYELPGGAQASPPADAAGE